MGRYSQAMSIHKYVKRSTLIQQQGIPWTQIPKEVKEDIEALQDYTKDTGREGSITMCKKPDHNRIITGNNFKGNRNQTLVLDCSSRVGKSSRIGSVHSHPTDDETVGVLASEGDLSSTIDDSAKYKRPQIDCITSPETPLIPCMMPKDIPSRKLVNEYDAALDESLDERKTAPYFLDNVHKDFHFALFDKKTGQREDNAPPKKIIKVAFGRSNKSLREHVKVFERGSFCHYVADLMGQHNREDVIQECRDELRRKSFLGLVDLPDD